MVLAEAPPGLAGAGAGAYTVVVSLTHGPANKSAALPGFAVWDGAAPRAVLVAPRKGLPTATAAAGRTLALRARVSVVVANLPAGLAPSDLAVTLGAEAVAVTEVRDTVVCAPAAMRPAPWSTRDSSSKVRSAHATCAQEARGVSD